MKMHDVINILDRLIPKFSLIEGCYLLVMEHRVFEADTISRLIHSTFQGDITTTEYHLNRCFILADILDCLVGNEEWVPENLIAVARCFAALVRDGLSCTYPTQKFQVKIIGENLVDIEPLELCVTFNQLK